MLEEALFFMGCHLVLSPHHRGAGGTPRGQVKDLTIFFSPTALAGSILVTLDLWMIASPASCALLPK